MTQTTDQQPTTLHGGPPRQQRSSRAGGRRSMLSRIRAFPRPEPEAPPWRGRPDEAYHLLQDARAVIAQGWIQDRWYARTPAPPRPRRAVIPPVGQPRRRPCCLPGRRCGLRRPAARTGRPLRQGSAGAGSPLGCLAGVAGPGRHGDRRLGGSPGAPHGPRTGSDAVERPAGPYPRGGPGSGRPRHQPRGHGSGEPVYPVTVEALI
jgi:hypothetical protein